MSTYTAFPATPEPKQYFPDSAPAEVKAVVRWLDKVYSAQWMGDMASALKRLVPDVDWTLPFIEFHSAGGGHEGRTPCCAPLYGAHSAQYMLCSIYRMQCTLHARLVTPSYRSVCTM